MKYLVIISALFFTCLGCKENSSGNTIPGSQQSALGIPDDTNKVVKSKKEWKEILPEDTYLVTREAYTEKAYSGKYLNNHRKGIYYCACCGLPLFSSETKFESNTGWPSFYQTISTSSTETKTDNSIGMARSEVLCKRCDAHLGHVFDDGPEPTGLRYCMNSVALNFRESK